MDATCKCGNSEQMCGAVYLPTYSSILARSVTPPPLCFRPFLYARHGKVIYMCIILVQSHFTIEIMYNLQAW